MGDLLDRIESRRVPASATRLNISQSGNDLMLRWWAESDSTHQVLQSVGDLNSFQPVGEPRQGQDDYLIYPVTVNSGQSVYFRLEITE